MELRQMRYFSRLYEHGGMAPAADSLYITPQALSKTIRALEEELGAELFVRGQGKLAATPFAKLLYGECCTLLAQYDHMEQRLAEALGTHTEKVCIAFAHGLMEADFAAFVLNYGATHPQLALEAMEMPDVFAEQYIKDGTAAFGFVIGPATGWEGLDATLLQRYRLCAVVTPAHPLATRETIPLAEALAYPLITKNNLFKVHGIVADCAAALGVTPTYALQSPNEVAWRQLIEEERGVGIGVSFYAGPNRKSNLCIIPFTDAALCWDVYLLSKPLRQCSPALRALQREITRRYGQAARQG